MFFADRNFKQDMFLLILSANGDDALVQNLDY